MWWVPLQGGAKNNRAFTPLPPVSLKPNPKSAEVSSLPLRVVYKSPVDGSGGASERHLTQRAKEPSATCVFQGPRGMTKC